MAPIILHHGLFEGDRMPMRRGKEAFPQIDRALQSVGNLVLISAVHPCASIEQRAMQLREAILEAAPRLGGKRATLIAHSMGGLDARYMLARLDMSRYVGALLTIATPHRGSSFADDCVRNLGRLGAFQLLKSLNIEIGAAADLTTERCAAFNETVRDMPDVQYFSVSSAVDPRRVPAIGRRAWRIIEKAEGPNDCLVSLRSAAWGTHLATWPVDHWQTINRRYSLGALRRRTDISPFYVSALRTVLAQGEAA